MYHRKLFFLTAAAFIFFSGNSFSQKTSQKYQSLLWEITGNGLKKPSYLFGTMHVSSKMVFHLPDSFYNALKKVDAVALELNPDVWQGQMVRLDQLQLNYKNFSQAPGTDYLNEKSFQLENYEDELKSALSSEPAIVNSLLYRSYKTKEDFEEDTFLDLYIFQIAKKLGKITTGVENYYQTEKIVLEAYADMAKEKNRKSRDTDGESMNDIEQKTEAAYRTGNLDLLDSLNIIMEASEAFRNKFLLSRNEIQANSIDTILKKHSLFVGVGAAHLPGEKGVIELLRKKGYMLRPVLMDVTSSNQKDTLDKLKAPVKFITNIAEDGSYKVDMPGPLYKMTGDNSGLNRRQYSDMSNGTYYLLTRVKTYTSFTNNNKDGVLNKVDSLLYENIPGKIIKKTTIKKNGYPGFDITNKTRRGDLQRYQIFVTPFEIMVFKMSGKENYIQGPEGERFFSSINLKEQNTGWINFEPKQGGFKIKLPQQPDEFINANAADGIARQEYEAVDKNSGNTFIILKKSVNNFRYLEEDTFDLGLIDESFKLSKFIAKQEQRNISSFNGYPCLDVQQTLKDGGIVKARFLIKGADYYLLAAKSKSNDAEITNFFSSFQFTPYQYPQGKIFVDTFLHYSVVTPVAPELEESFRALIENIGDVNPYRFGTLNSDSYWPKTKNALFKSDSTGEEIAVAMQQYPKYYYVKDSAAFWKGEVDDYLKRTGFIVAKKEFFRKDDIAGYRLILRDTNSSRQINRVLLLKNDRLYRLVSMSDTLSAESDFVKNFYATFTPADSPSPGNIFTSNINKFLKDFYSSDSATHAKAVAAISNVYYTKKDIPNLVSIINNLSYNDKDYFDEKTRFIAELGYINDTTATNAIVTALKNIYTKSGDTATFQNAVLRALAKNKTKQSYVLLREFIIQDPPVFDNNYEYTALFNDINDSLLLARQLFPDIMQLSTIDDYKDNINSLLVKLVDSGLIRGSDYESYYTKIYFDAMLELKKQSGKDEKKLVLEKNKADNDRQNLFTSGFNFSQSKTGLNSYAVLLMPFYDSKPQVKNFFNKILYSKDPLIQLSVATLLLRNNKYVPDSILFNLASNDLYRARLFRGLNNPDIADKFPAQFKNQIDFAKSVLVSNKNYSKIDSIVYLSSRLITLKNNTGRVYFFKYRIKKDDDWKIGISGLQPENIDKVSRNDDLTKMTNKKIVADEPLNDQLEKQLKRLLFSISKSGKRFYESETYSRFTGIED